VEFIIRMKTITRFLIFLAAILLWLILLVLANTYYLNLDDLVIVAAALVLALATTFGSVKILRT
jgi:hypothetical protein